MAGPSGAHHPRIIYCTATPKVNWTSLSNFSSILKTVRVNLLGGIGIVFVDRGLLKGPSTPAVVHGKFKLSILQRIVFHLSGYWALYPHNPTVHDHPVHQSVTLPCQISGVYFKTEDSLLMVVNKPWSSHRSDKPLCQNLKSVSWNCGGSLFWLVGPCLGMVGPCLGVVGP